jgi:glycosyltransferase involved in cell wall biosynthesis
MRAMLEDIFTRIRLRIKDVKLDIVGRSPWKIHDRSGMEGIRLDNNVPGIIPFLRTDDRLIYPLRIDGVRRVVIPEALTCGCPVACFKVTIIPEIVGEAVLFFDATSKKDIVDKIWTVCHDTSIRDQLVSNGYKRAKLFQWKKTAKETIEVYRNALEILSRGTVFPDRGARV